MADSWTLVIPGQPPSVNALYKIGWVYLPGGKTVSKLVKRDGIELYQTGVTYMTKAARPSGWKAGERVRLIFSYYLVRDADCDNLKKAMNDAIAQGLGCDDKVFLSCDRLKLLGDPQPRVVVEISNEAEDGHRCIA